MILVTTIDAQECPPRLSIVFRYVAAARTGLAGVVGRHSLKHAAVPRDLITKLSPELAPPLIEDATIEAAFLAHVFARLFDRALGRPGHVPHLQILNANERGFWLIVVVVLCRKSLRALAMRV